MKVQGLFPAILALVVTPTSADKYGYNHVPVRKDPELLAKNFKPVDVELLSPSFLSPGILQSGFQNGTQGPTSQQDMISFLKEVTGRNKYMSYETASFSSEEGRSMPYIHLSSGGSDKKVRIWVQSAVHGNEPAGDEATQAFLGKLDKDSELAQKLLQNVEIVVLPRYNPDGVFYFQRYLPSNFDPNRDHVKLARQQTRDIKGLMNEFNPHVVVDMHEYGGHERFGQGRYAHASDGLFSAAKNLNINEEIRNMSEKLFVPKMGEAMEAAGLRWEPYVTAASTSGGDGYVGVLAEAGSDAKIGRNAMGLTQAVVFLTETRGITLADQHFERRTQAGLTMLLSVIQTASDNAAKVLETVEGGIQKFISSSENIVITDYSKVSIRPFKMIDVENGSLVSPPVQFVSATPVIANLTRSRPEAYIIPAAWNDVAERLRVSGLKVTRLCKPWKGTVEALSITSASFDDKYYQGIVQVTVKTETKKRELALPAGSFYVSTRQKNAGLAFVALEPENIDSYVSTNVVPVVTGDEYPIFRVTS